MEQLPCRVICASPFPFSKLSLEKKPASFPAPRVPASRHQTVAQPALLQRRPGVHGHGQKRYQPPGFQETQIIVPARWLLPQNQTTSRRKSNDANLANVSSASQVLNSKKVRMMFSEDTSAASLTALLSHLKGAAGPFPRPHAPIRIRQGTGRINLFSRESPAGARSHMPT